MAATATAVAATCYKRDHQTVCVVPPMQPTQLTTSTKRAKTHTQSHRRPARGTT